MNNKITVNGKEYNYMPTDVCKAINQVGVHCNKMELEIEKLKDQNKKLQEKIDKANKFLSGIGFTGSTCNKSEGCSIHQHAGNIFRLKEILKE